MSVLPEDVRTAFEEVKRRFPFRDYLDESVFAEVDEAAREMRRHLGDVRGKRLLDIGCGPMDKAAVFRLLGFDVWTTDDLSDPWHRRDDNLALIEQFARDFGIHFHRQPDGDYRVPFPPESFDVVTAFNIVEHLHGSPRELFNSMGGLAKTGGLIVIVMPNSVNLRKRLDVLRGRTNYVRIEQFFHHVGPWRGHVREYTLEETAYVCRAAGFEVVSARAFESLARTMLRPPLRQIYLAITALMPTLRTALLVIARKPAGWQPVPEDEERFRAALGGMLPRGVQ